jgi:hypothetical protein
MLTVNRIQFEAIKTQFAKLRSELNKGKLTEFQENVKFFTEHAPYAPSGEVVTRQEWNELAKEVSKAHRLAVNAETSGTTSEYTRYKEQAARGIDGHPDCKSHVHAEINSQLRTNPELRELASGLAGMSKSELKKELPK